MARKLDDVKELIVDLVVPRERSKVNIVTQHLSVLRGTKRQKQLSRKQSNRRATGLTRREYVELGLNCLPTQQMQYEEALPLHQLWLGYMHEHLGLADDQTVPQVHEAEYEAFSKALVRTDLHGAILRVIESKCTTLLGLSGIVVLESKNTIKLVGKDHRIRTIPKAECVFSMQVGNAEFILFGKQLTIRPTERSVKKIKTNITIEA